MSDIEEIFEEAVPEPSKRKKQLSQKQLDGLAKGRARMAEKRNAKKKQTEFEAKMIEQKQSNRRVKREIVKADDEEAHYRTLLANDEKTKKLKNFKELRTKYLKRCQTKEDFDELRERLDAIDEDDICDNARLKEKLIKMLSNYKR